jgi:hypothetical protein
LAAWRLGGLADAGLWLNKFSSGVCGMYLVRLLYVSQVKAGFSSADLQAVLEAARRHNVKNGISGLLAFNGDYFLQVLEGGREAVNRLYQSISCDSRHEDILLLQLSDISARMFSSWSMAYVPTAMLTRDLMMRFSCHGQFLPLEMSASSCLGLLQALSEQLPAAE